MPQTTNRPASNAKSVAAAWTNIGLAAVLAFFLISGAIAYLNVQVLRENQQKILHSHTVLVALDKLISTMQDAETGQRGYLLTGNDKYLAPYNEAVAAVGSRLDTVASLTGDNAAQQRNIVQLRRHLDAKLGELGETIDLRRIKGTEAALALVNTDRGKFEMDAIRSQADLMRQEEQRLREIRIAEMDRAFETARASGIISGLLGAVLTVLVFIMIRRSANARARQQWLQAGEVGLANAMMGDKSVEQVADSILAFLAEYLGFQAGALFKGEQGRYRRVATLGVPGDADMPLGFAVKEGLMG